MASEDMNPDVRNAVLDDLDNIMRLTEEARCWALGRGYKQTVELWDREESLIGIGGIPEAVAEEVENQHGEYDEEAGYQEPGMQRYGAKILGVLQKNPPADHRRSEPEPKEAQSGFSQDHPGNRQRKAHDQIAEKSRKQVSDYYSHIAGSCYFCGHGKILLPQLEDLTSNDSRQATPPADGKDNRNTEVDPYR